MTAKAGKAGAEPALADGSRDTSGAAKPLANGAAVVISAAEPVSVEPAELADSDFACPICMSQLRDPFVTTCGHSFCHACVSKHLAHRKNCPSCAAYLTVDGIFPNFLLQKARPSLCPCSCSDSATYVLGSASKCRLLQLAIVNMT